MGGLLRKNIVTFGRLLFTTTKESMFRKRIAELVNRKIGEIKKHQNRMQQTQLDYAQLTKLFPQSSFVPYTSWAMAPETLLHMLNDIVLNTREHIIEFGSGTSTLYIAQLIKTQGLSVRFFSVESDENWIQKMENELRKLGLEGIVTFILAPITEASPALRLDTQKTWYDAFAIEKVLKNERIDLVIVDGPYGKSTPFARYSALPFIKPYLKADFAVFLDDIQRVEEKAILAEWAVILGLKPQKKHRHGYFSTNTRFSIDPFQIR